MRATFSGNIQIGGTAVPVKLYTGARRVKSSKAKTHYACPECGGDVGKKNYCKNPECGEEFSRSEIKERKFRISDEEEVVLKKEELNSIKKAGGSNLKIIGFRQEASMWTSKPYFIKADVDENPEAKKVLTILSKAMLEEDVVAIGKYVHRNTEKLIQIKPKQVEGEIGLVGQHLFFEQGRRSPPENWSIDGTVKEDQIGLGEKLIEKRLDVEIPENSEFYENFKELVKQKQAGETIEVEQEERTPTGGLMDSLKETAEAEVEAEAQEVEAQG